MLHNYSSLVLEGGGKSTEKCMRVQGGKDSQSSQGRVPEKRQLQSERGLEIS
jgi:hypothetical protein